MAGEILQNTGGLFEALGLEVFQKLIHGQGRILQSFPLTAHPLQKQEPIRGHEFQKKVVGVLRLDAVGFELRFGEILEVEGDDCFRTSLDGRRQDVSVIGIREVEFGKESTVRRDVGFWKRVVHQTLGSFQCVPFLRGV